MINKPKPPFNPSDNKKENRQRQITIETFDSVTPPATEPTHRHRANDAATAITNIVANNTAYSKQEPKKEQETEEEKKNEKAADVASNKTIKRDEVGNIPCSIQQDSPYRASPHNPTTPASSTPFFSRSHADSSSAQASSCLWLAAHCSQLAIEVTQNTGIDIPAIVVDEHERHPRILAVNDKGIQAGLTPGLPLSVAHTLLSRIKVTTYNPAAVITRLHYLAELSERFTPAVSVEPPDILLMEVLGSIKLFGSLQNLKDQLIQTFIQQGHSVQCATSPSPTAAALMARAGIYSDAQNHVTTLRKIRSIAIRHLDLTDRQHRTLSGMGLRTVNDLIRLPRDGLARRISPTLLGQLDRIRGLTADPRHLYRASRYFHREYHFDEPVSDVRFILVVANQLIDALAQELVLSSSAVHELNWTMTHMSQPATSVRLMLTHAARHAEHLHHLVKERFERLHLNEAVDTLILTTSRFEQSQGNSLDLFGHLPAQANHAAFALLDRLHSRLGEHAVSGLSIVAEHRPEQAWKRRKPHETHEHGKEPGGKPATSPHRSNRPTWLLEKPLPLHVVQGKPCFRGPLTLLDTQERIESGWWDKTPIQRDYYVALNSHGERLWIFLDLKNKKHMQWYLHGFFS